MKIQQVKTRIFDGIIIYDMFYSNNKPLYTYLPITRLPSIVVNFDIEIVDENFVYFYNGDECELIPYYEKNKAHIDNILNENISECVIDFSNYLNFIYNLRK